MLSVVIGPLALPVVPLLVIAAIWGSSQVALGIQARRLARPRRDVEVQAAGTALLVAAAIGLAAARLAYLVAHAGSYAAAPLAVLDIRDGGWSPVAGLVAAAAWVAVHAWRHPARAVSLAVGGLLALGFLLAILAVTSSRQGQAMPTLPLVRLADGAGTQLAAVADGRPLVVNLWAGWCAPCRAEMPGFVEAQRQHPEVIFVFVNQGEPDGAVRTHAAAWGLAAGSVLLDPASALGAEVGSRMLPTTLFYDASGRLVQAHAGVLSAVALDARVRSLADAR